MDTYLNLDIIGFGGVETRPNHGDLSQAEASFLIFVIRFFRGETDQVSGASFMLSSVVKFGQILPIGSTHFGFFC